MDESGFFRINLFMYRSTNWIQSDSEIDITSKLIVDLNLKPIANLELC